MFKKKIKNTLHKINHVFQSNNDLSRCLLSMQVLLPGLVLLFPFLMLIHFNRMSVDDFCIKGMVNQSGFFGAQINFYKTWSGRYASTFFTVLFSVTSFKNSLTLYSILILSVLILSSYLYLRSVEKTSRLVSFSAAIFIIGIFFLLTPNKGQSWFWLAGSATYLLPLVWATFILTIFLKDTISKTDFYILPLLVSMISGANEVVAFMLPTFFALTFLYSVLNPNINKKKKYLYIIALIATIISSTILYIAPGNKIRQSAFTEHPGVELALVNAVEAGPTLFITIIKQHQSFVLFGTLFLGLLFSEFSRKREPTEVNKYLSNMGYYLAGLFPACILYAFVGEYTLNRIQPDRSHITIVYLIIVGMVVVAKVLAFPLAKVKQNVNECIRAFLFAILMCISIAYYTSIRASIVSSINYSRGYDIMIKSIMTAVEEKVQNIKLVSLPPPGIFYSAAVGTNPTNWINACTVKGLGLPKGTTIYAE